MREWEIESNTLPVTIWRIIEKEMENTRRDGLKERKRERERERKGSWQKRKPPRQIPVFQPGETTRNSTLFPFWNLSQDIPRPNFFFVIRSLSTFELYFLFGELILKILIKLEKLTVLKTRFGNFVSSQILRGFDFWKTCRWKICVFF